MALASVGANKTRSFLTMLGVIIGITSVIVMVGIGEGSTKSVTDAIQGMGTNLLTVSLTGSKTASLTDKDISELKSYPSIKDVAPVVTGNVTVKAGSENSTTSLEGSVPGYSAIRNVGVAIGRFITQDDINNRYKVADIGVEVIQNLYPDLTIDNYQSLIGKTISVNGIDVQVIGILESKGTSAAGSSDNRMIMPLSTAERLLENTTVKTYYIEASSADDTDQASAVLNQVMLNKFDNDSSQFRVMDQSSLLQTREQAINQLKIMIAGIAGISLLVGGIGIMNIMLVSVTERTREIGIRKAIGAKRSDIMLQFLIEAVFLSCLGGITGLALGMGLCLLIPAVSSQSVLLDPVICVLSFAFSAVVGIVFGLYPASKASKLRPIEALRYE